MIETNKIDSEIKESARIQTRLDTSAIMNGGVEGADFRRKVIKEIEKECPPEIFSIFFERIADLSNINLERMLALILNFPPEVTEFFAKSDNLNSSRIQDFFNSFDDDKLRMIFLLSDKADRKFNRFSFGFKCEVLRQATSLADFEKLILNAKSEADGSDGN